MDKLGFLHPHEVPSPKLPAVDFTVGERHTHRHPVYASHWRRVAMIKNDMDANAASGGTFGTGTGIPGPQSTGIGVGGSSINISWGTVQNASSYKIYRGTSSGGETLLASGQNAQPYVDNTGLNHGTTYYYQVTAIVNSVETQRSPEISGLFV